MEPNKDCRCNPRTKLVGDGCEICNPRLALEHAKERIAELGASIARHFAEEHLAGDGPEIDRWKRRVAAQDAAILALREEKNEPS